jgi:hypothetical protein
LVTSYQKSNPGNIHYYSIDEKNYHIDAEPHKIATKMNADGCTLTVDEYILEIGIKKKKWIDVIYFSNSKKRTVKRILSAKNGAIRIPLY